MPLPHITYTLQSSRIHASRMAPLIYPDGIVNKYSFEDWCREGERDSTFVLALNFILTMKLLVVGIKYIYHGSRLV